MHDEEVTIVRVINSMEPGQTVKAHCPLRFVAINLQINNQQTRNLVRNCRCPRTAHHTHIDIGR